MDAFEMKNLSCGSREITRFSISMSDSTWCTTTKIIEQPWFNRLMLYVMQWLQSLSSKKDIQNFTYSSRISKI